MGASNTVCFIDEAHELNKQAVASMLANTPRKYGQPLALKPELSWALLNVGTDTLPRNRAFNALRSKDGDTQYDNIVAAVKKYQCVKTKK